jgi:hypothetical protein
LFPPSLLFFSCEGAYLPRIWLHTKVLESAKGKKWFDFGWKIRYPFTNLTFLICDLVSPWWIGSSCCQLRLPTWKNIQVKSQLFHTVLCCFLKSRFAFTSQALICQLQIKSNQCVCSRLRERDPWPYYKSRMVVIRPDIPRALWGFDGLTRRGSFLGNRM